MNWKDLASTIESFAKIAAIIIGAAWAYWKFFIQRTGEPATDIDIDVKFVGRQHGNWIVEITVFLENRSQVRLNYRDFWITARYVLPDDPIADGKKEINYQLDCRRTINERINGEKRSFSNVAYMNPKQQFRQRYITYIPGDATFLWLQARFLFKMKEWEVVNSQRIFRVPDDESGPAADSLAHHPMRAVPISTNATVSPTHNPRTPHL